MSMDGMSSCERFYALKSGKREGRVNMIAALCNQKLLAPFTVEGVCNRTVFETWLEKCLVPALQPGFGVVLLVNAVHTLPNHPCSNS